MTLQSGGRIHFIGIGGAGMSAIAKVLLERGFDVSGSDLKPTAFSATLEAMGVRMHIGHDPTLVDGSGFVVASSAIAETNPELRHARELGLRVMTRGEALAAVLEGSRSIVVAGTHGKTTTTSMVVSVLRSVDADPTYLVGAGLNDAGTNARSGAGELAVAESDESDGSFLLLRPHIAIVTNVEADHLDYWGSFDAIRAGFARFIQRVEPNGAVVVPADDEDVVKAARATGSRVVTFGPDGDVEARDVFLGAEGTRFVLARGSEEATVRLHVPGTHNVLNALAAATGCLLAGLSVEEVARGLGGYRGVQRRFQIRGRARGVTVIDDYAHHPSEVSATLDAAARGEWGRLVAVFQPHRYSRTAALYKDFSNSFEAAHRVVVTDVYGAGEEPVPGVSGMLVAESVCDGLPGRPVAYIPHRKDLLDYLAATTRPGDALLTLGAGDITSVGEELLARLGAGS